MNYNSFSVLFSQVLATYESQTSSLRLSDNKSKYFGKDPLDRDLEERGFISLSSHIYETTGKSIGGSTLYQSYYEEVRQYYEGKEKGDKEFGITPEKLSILQEYVQIGIERSWLKLPFRQVPPEGMGKFGIAPSPLLREYYDSRWYLYIYFEYPVRENPIVGKPKTVFIWGVGRMLMNIDRQGKVYIENFNQVDGRSIPMPNYIGTMEEEEDGIVGFQMRTQRTNETSLHIKWMINRRGIFPFGLGSYINRDSEDHLIAGTIVFEKVNVNEGEQISPKADFFQVGSEKYSTLEDGIRDYLRDRRHNYLNIPKGINSQDRLFAWLEEKRRENYRRPDRYRNFKYDVFIASPITALNQAEREELQQWIAAIKSVLKESRGMERVYFAGQDLEDLGAMWQDAYVGRTEVLSQIAQSRYFMLVYPNNMISSSLIETGWALGIRKPAIVFCHYRADLPTLLGSSKIVQKLVAIHNYTYETLEDILTVLRADPDLFDWD